MRLDSRHSLAVLAIAVVLAACAPAADIAPINGSNTNAVKPVAAEPTADAFLRLDKQAKEAFVKGDGTFFEAIFSDQLVMQKGGYRISKTDFIKMFSSVTCEVKPGWTLTDPQMLKIDNDTYVLTYKSNMEGSCATDGKTENIPSPVRAATVWVRNGKEWQTAFHGENLIVDTQAPPETVSKEDAAQEHMAVANAKPAASPAAAKPTADLVTDALMAAENSAWEAWMAKDAKKIEGLMAKEIIFVNIFGTNFANKADAIKDWTGATCEVEGISLTDGVGTSISPSVGILTLTGTVNGSCGGQDISGQKIYANTVYVKDGDVWKWVFGFNSPS